MADLGGNSNLRSNTNKYQGATKPALLNQKHLNKINVIVVLSKFHSLPTELVRFKIREILHASFYCGSVRS